MRFHAATLTGHYTQPRTIHGDEAIRLRGPPRSGFDLIGRRVGGRVSNMTWPRTQVAPTDRLHGSRRISELTTKWDTALPSNANWHLRALPTNKRRRVTDAGCTRVFTSFATSARMRNYMKLCASSRCTVLQNQFEARFSWAKRKSRMEGVNLEWRRSFGGIADG